MSKSVKKIQLPPATDLFKYLDIHLDKDTENQLKDSKTLPVDLSRIKAISEHTRNSYKSLNIKSLIDKISNFWGKIPIWLKITGGAAFAIPFLAGLNINATYLVAIAIGGAAGYFIISYLLDNHYNYTRIKNKDINEIAENLSGLIESLCVFLSSNIAKLSEENKALQDSINKLEKKINDLNQTVENLESTSEKLEKTENQLTQTTSQLNTKVGELKTLKTQYSLEIEELKRINDVLKGTLETMSSGLLADQEDRTKFITKLKNFLGDSKKEFHSIAKRICESEKELAKVKSKLEACNNQYDSLLKQHSNLLKQQEVQLTRLAKIPEQPSDASSYDSTKKHRLFNNERMTSLESPEQEAKETKGSLKG